MMILEEFHLFLAHVPYCEKFVMSAVHDFKGVIIAASTSCRRSRLGIIKFFLK